MANDQGANEDPLPPGVKGADFRTLQDMIAKGIQDAETGATKLEATITQNDNDDDLARHREALRRRREEDMAARQREKEAAREKRRKEDEARRRRLQEEMDREEEEERRQKETKQNVEATCRRQMVAASRIQARFRGGRSRMGHAIASPVVVAKLHTEPWTPTK